MPELPEVETIRRQLAPAVEGRQIEAVEILDARWTRPASPRSVEEALTGRTIQAVERRGKYLVLRLDGYRSLVVHLRMTGNLVLDPGGAGKSTRLGGARFYQPRDDLRHLRAVIALDDGSGLLYTDARRFGHAVVLDGYALEGYLSARLGIEPLSGALTAQALADLADGRQTPLKSFLLEQQGVAGIGNIYADEALYRAGLHPLSPVGSMKLEDCEELREGIVEALEAGLQHGGASIDDYRDARGERGAMQDEFLVHTRAGEPCRRCAETIERIVVAGRATYFCPWCQRKLRARPRRPRAASAG